jgi:phosphoribosylamine---glycine ligase
MNVLLIGSGGREHALAFKLAPSPLLDQLFIAPGNGGTGQIGENVALEIENHDDVIAFCHTHQIALVIVGPEAPLVAGLADDLRKAQIDVFGPSKAAAQLEGSKVFTKILCGEMNIPTAAYARFEAADAALAYAQEKGAPLVIKADGLAAGKGVTVALDLKTAETAIKACFSGAFGAAGAEIIIEEYLSGPEVSVFAICDGQRFITLATAQDHKRALDGDKGPNTGGMGAYSPALVMTPELLAQVETKIIAPTLLGMAQRGTPFQGVLFAGLMLTNKGPRLIEHNVRFGDPECQVLMMRMQSDLLELLLASARGDLSGIKVRWRDEAALCVVMAAAGYPGPYQRGSEIVILENQNTDNVQIFHAGTKVKDQKLLASGGRVLAVTALGQTLRQAKKNAYTAIEQIDWPQGFYRRDIGWRAMASETGRENE